MTGRDGWDHAPVGTVGDGAAAALGAGSLCGILHRNGQDTARYYDSLRRSAGPNGVFWDEALRAWIVTGYASCRALLASRALSKSRLRFDALDLPLGLAEIVERAQGIVDRQMIFDDSDDAVRARRAWTDALRVGLDRALPMHLTESARAVLTAFPRGTPADLYATVLRPYVSRAIADRLGLSESERRHLYPLVYRYADFLDGKVLDPKGIAEALLSLLLLTDFVATRFESLRHVAPLAAHDRERWIADYTLNLVAGHESTAYLLGIALFHGGPVPGAFDSDEAIHALVTEALRFDSPIQMVGRIASEDIVLADRRIRRGDRVFLHLGAANRDPARFPEPDRFSLERGRSDVLSFGWGPSRCVGISLALTEARTFLATMRATLGGRQFAFGAPSWAHGLAGRAFHTLPALAARLRMS